MKIRAVILVMMALMLSAGPLMAMDSEYLEKRRQQLDEKSGNSVMQTESSIDQHRDRAVSKRGGGQRRLAGDNGELTQEGLRYWWN